MMVVRPFAKLLWILSHLSCPTSYSVLVFVKPIHCRGTIALKIDYFVNMVIFTSRFSWDSLASLLLCGNGGGVA